MLVVVLLVSGILGCAATRNIITGNRQVDSRDNITGDMAGVWEIVMMSRNGRFNTKMELTQQGHRLQGYFFTQSYGEFWLLGTIRENEFVLKADSHYGPSGGFMIKLTGHIAGDQASGKTYFGPQWVPWNLNYVNENYHRIRRGTFTAKRNRPDNDIE